MSLVLSVQAGAARGGFPVFPSPLDLIRHLCRRFARYRQGCLYLD